MNEWCKCNFCIPKCEDSCSWCSNYNNYSPDADTIIKIAKNKFISVADVIKLIEYCGG